MTETDKKYPRPEFPMEMRMGLAMSGGISLVLYQSGAAHEALRFMRSWDAPEGSPDYSSAYAKAFQTVPIKPVLDIVTGASAGAINCVLLGHCMATGKTFDAFHDIWIQAADIARLEYGSSEQPKSLLNRDPLIARLRTVMRTDPDKEDKEVVQRKIWAGDIDLITRLCRTDYFGHCLSTTDAIGHSLSLQSQANVIGFSLQDFEPAPVEDPQKLNIEKQLSAGAASSAFPGAFAPASETIAPDPNIPDKWYIDGGLWNNQPLDLAVQAVHDKPAIDRTHRCIFVVQPDPVFVDNKKGRGLEPSFLEVLASVPLMGLNGSLWPAIENILDFNQRSQLYQDLLQDTHVEKALISYGETQWDASARQLGLVLQTTPLSDGGDKGEQANRTNSVVSLSKVASPCKPTLLNQVRINALLFDDDSMLIERWNALLLRLGYRDDAPCKSADIALKAIQAALDALNCIGTYDLTQRTVRHQIEKLNQDLAAKQDSERLENIGSDQLDAHREMRKEKAVLYAQLERLGQYLCCGRKGEACEDPLDEDVSAFQDIFKPQSRFRKPSHQMLNDTEKVLKQQQPWNLVQEGNTQANWEAAIEPCLTQWVMAVADCAQKAQEDLNQDLTTRKEKWVQMATFRNWPQDDHTELATIIDARPMPAPSPIDYAGYILGAISDIAGKKPIDLIRISPDDTDNLGLIGKNEPDPNDENALPASKIKLAGVGLGHFSGFFQEDWRRNDYIWARLDAAEVFLRTLQTLGFQEGYNLPEADYQKLLVCVQTEILQNEAALWKNPALAEVVKGVPREKPTPNMVAGINKIIEANQQMIGFGGQQFSDADQPQRTRDLNYLVNTLTRVLSEHSSKTPVALRVVQGLLFVFSWGVRAALGLASPVGRILVPVLTFIIGLVYWRFLSPGIHGKIDVHGVIEIFYGVVVVLLIAYYSLLIFLGIREINAKKEGSTAG